MMQTSTKLTNLQQELLKIYSYDLPEEELKEIKKILANFFMDRAVDEADKFWDEQGLTNQDMDKWVNDPNQ